MKQIADAEEERARKKEARAHEADWIREEKIKRSTN